MWWGTKKLVMIKCNYVLGTTAGQQVKCGAMGDVKHGWCY